MAFGLAFGLTAALLLSPAAGGARGACAHLANLCLVSYVMGYDYGYEACEEIQRAEMDKELRRVAFFWCRMGYQDSFRGRRREGLWKELFDECMRRCRDASP